MASRMEMEDENSDRDGNGNGWPPCCWGQLNDKRNLRCQFTHNA